MTNILCTLKIKFRIVRSSHLWETGTTVSPWLYVEAKMSYTWRRQLSACYIFKSDLRILLTTVVTSRNLLKIEIMRRDASIVSKTENYRCHVTREWLFLPRCMECRRGLAMRILSVCLSVCLSNAWFVTKRKKLCPHSHTTWKNIYPSVVTIRMVGGGRPLPEILGQPASFDRNRRFWTDIRLLCLSRNT